MASRLHDLSVDSEEAIPLVATNRAQKARHDSDQDVDEEEEEEDADWAELSALEEELALENHAYPARSSQDIESNHKRRAYNHNHKALNEDDDDEGDQDATDPALQMVKAVVKETDDPSLPNITFRVLFLGTILCAVGAAISQLFFVCEFER